MTRLVKRVAAIHDLSGFGRSSLAVVIPILSTMGVQVCAVPTAILSTQTDGFEGYTFVDLTDSLEQYINHWHQLGIEFDCIYSGFLGSDKQINIVSKFIDDFSVNKPWVVIDPVMGDNGQLYSTMNPEMVQKMKNLIKKADIITPNFTEAAYLLDENYDLNIKEKDIKSWLIRLSKMGPKIVVITSVPDNNSPENTSVMAYNREDNHFWKVSCVYIPAHYPGTGDVFTSVLIGSILKGESLPIALDRGVDFITSAISASFNNKHPEREGVLLEKVLTNLNLPVLKTNYELLD